MHRSSKEAISQRDQMGELSRTGARSEAAEVKSNLTQNILKIELKELDNGLDI